jgi:hypothetical protein
MKLELPGWWTRRGVGGDGTQHNPTHAKCTSYLMMQFYKPRETDPIINRLVAWVDGPFSHVEISFPDGTASSIFASERVFMHERRFANPQYQSVSIPATEEQVRRAREFCSEAAQRGVAFDGVAMYASHVPKAVASPVRWLVRMARRWSWGKRLFGDTEGGTFCSQYVVRVLQFAGMRHVEGVDADRASPSSIFRSLHSRVPVSEDASVTRPDTIIAMNPYYRKMLAEKGVVATGDRAV